MKRSRALALATATVGVAAVMLAMGATAGRIGGSSPPGAVSRGPAASPPGVLSRTDAASNISRLQARLKALPEDWSSWASLGALYTAQAQLIADPSYYTKADGAFARSLEIHPKDNATALTGKATLASSRHDFSGALALARASERLNAYNASNLGVMFDALGELGRYPEAFAVLQRMVDLKPGVPSYTRVSYAYELRGDNEGARFALTRALEVAQRPADTAFARQYLGELAFNSGDLATAEKHFTRGLLEDPMCVPLLAGRARIEAARGRTEEALRDWQEVTNRMPKTTYLIEYADYLASLGRDSQARAQYAVIEAMAKLYRTSGANVDLELSLFDADHGRGNQALATARAEQARRQSSQVEDAYAWALHAAGQDTKALEHARSAANLGMRNALFSYHRGIIEKSLGRRTAAIASLNQALTFNPYFSPLQAPHARRALAELTENGG
jgi:tetratricopeptide (TPR) repeat protein